MLFRAENLGPLREAEVDLSKDLIVLTGPNNSGKTYLAWSLYGLAQFKPTDDFPFLNGLVDKMLSSPEHEIELDDLTPYWQETLSSVAARYQPELDRCFAAQDGYFEEARLSFVVDNPAMLTTRARRRRETRGTIATHMVEDRWWLTFGSGIGSSRVKLELQDMGNTAAGMGIASLSEEGRSDLRVFLFECLVSIMLEAVFQRCILFPAERIAVNIFAKELALKRTELVDELLDAKVGENAINPIDLVRQRAGRYSLPIRLSLRVANDLARISKKKSSIAEDLADELEAALLGGRVSVSEYGEMVFIPNSAPERGLSVHLTASVVKSLASLVFYFRHMAEPYDFLIIDEPELNLHPDNQRKIARILAKAVNRGFKIMMSTHSDYIIRELNHLIMLNQKSEAATRLIEELGYDRGSILDPNRVGVYLFNEHHSENVPVTETGFAVKTIEDEINKLNLVSQRIYASLFS